MLHTRGCSAPCTAMLCGPSIEFAAKSFSTASNVGTSLRFAGSYRVSELARGPLKSFSGNLVSVGGKKIHTMYYVAGPWCRTFTCFFGKTLSPHRGLPVLTWAPSTATVLCTATAIQCFFASNNILCYHSSEHITVGNAISKSLLMVPCTSSTCTCLLECAKDSSLHGCQESCAFGLDKGCGQTMA